MSRCREVGAHKTRTASGLAMLGVNLASVESVKEDIKVVKAQLSEHKTTVEGELEALKRINLRLRSKGQIG